jgi:uncharacterized protein (TIGR00369 family)
MSAEELPNLLPAPDGTARWIRRAWDLLASRPLGKQLFARYLGFAIPYTGSIDAQVVELSPGFARVQLRDERRVRNHLESIHAAALCNLAELTANAALAYSLPEDSRFIVLELNVRYLKKARGTLSASCQCPVPPDNTRRNYELQVVIDDAQGERVAEATITTLVGPVPV